MYPGNSTAVSPPTIAALCYVWVVRATECQGYAKIFCCLHPTADTKEPISRRRSLARLWCSSSNNKEKSPSLYPTRSIHEP